MMETFLVLGLCFILYEALDFFQGCIHSNTPSPSDQIEAYRRELDEQRQQQQQEQFLAGLTPLLGAQFAAAAAAAAGSQSTLSSTTTPTASTASVISDSYESQSQSQSQSHSQSQSQSQAQQPHSLSTPGLFRPAALGYYDPEDPLHATSSLPRDYYYLQQQQLKNKASSKSLLSKFSLDNSDNRIHPEAAGPHGVLGVPAAAVITTQPQLAEASAHLGLFDCQPQLLPLHATAPLLLELKRAIISNDTSQKQQHQQQQQQQYDVDELSNNDNDNDCPQCLDEAAEEDNDDDDADEDSSSCSSGNSPTPNANSEPNICAAVAVHLPRIHHIAIDDIGIGGPLSAVSGGSQNQVSSSLAHSSSSSTSHADFREIECERLRRKCVSVKRIYSISEKF
ncbi:CG15465 [Drosophila busckii]|uniref:CG15465 n=1 Tax=Drosophila busckii TaxID=30019 RepID=A0A0M4ESM0_DROBS|nr:myb-like protein AA isoform X2 [Drosophila busckii]ALC48351.1 CG15465 [Drosophila busckii]